MLRVALGAVMKSENAGPWRRRSSSNAALATERLTDPADSAGTVPAMPVTAEAAIVFLVVVVPGFLAMSGYRAGRAVPEHPQGLVATARVFTTSTIIAVAAWRVGGQELYNDARRGTALTTHEGHTYLLAIGLLVAPPVIGYVLGQCVDVAARRALNARDNLCRAPGPDEKPERWGRRLRRGLLMAVSARLLHEGPTTWDRTWKQIRRTQPYVFVRVTTKSGQEIIGTVADASRIALSPQPRDLYLEQVWRPGADAKLYPTAFGLGAFVSGTEIEAVEWVSQQGAVSNG